MLPTPTGAEDLGGLSLPRHWGKDRGGGRKRAKKARAPREGLASPQSPYQWKGRCGGRRGAPRGGTLPRPGSAVRLPFAAASPSSSSAAAASPTRAAVSTVAASAAAASESTRQGGHLSPSSLPAQPPPLLRPANSLRPPPLPAEGEGRGSGWVAPPPAAADQKRWLGGVAVPAARLRLARPPCLALPPPPHARLPSPHPPGSRSRSLSLSPLLQPSLNQNTVTQYGGAAAANTARSAAALRRRP